MPAAAPRDDEATGRPSSSSSSSAAPFAAPRSRALLVALPLLCCICFIFADMSLVANEVQFVVVQLASPVVVVLFFIALPHRVMARLPRRQFLSGADIVVIYAMLLVGVMVSTR